MGRVDQLWTALEGSAPMESHDERRAVAGRGLAGDRYATGRGYYSGFDECEVTFVEREALAEVDDRWDIDLTDGRHRRNVVVSGVDTRGLLDARFRVGEAVFEGTRPRPPCVHVEDVAGEDGVMEALGGQRGGICARVVEGGTVAVGDALDVLDEPVDSDDLAAAIRRRLVDK
jgi:MOSC domain-containing protein YiiM